MSKTVVSKNHSDPRHDEPERKMKNTRIRKSKKPVRSFKFRLYPTSVQEERLERSINTYRKIYNDFIRESRLAYKEGYNIKPAH